MARRKKKKDAVEDGCIYGCSGIDVHMEKQIYDAVKAALSPSSDAGIKQQVKIVEVRVR